VGLVQHEHGVLAGLLALDEEVLERDEPLRPGFHSLRDAEVLEDVLEDAVERQAGVDDEGDRGLGAEALSERVQQRRLPGADAAGEDDEALALARGVHELGQRLPVRRAHIEEARVRGRVEGLLVQRVEPQIHRLALTTRPRG
jgi:hypothetical protein